MSALGLSLGLLPIFNCEAICEEDDWQSILAKKYLGWFSWFRQTARWSRRYNARTKSVVIISQLLFSECCPRVIVRVKVRVMFRVIDYTYLI